MGQLALAVIGGAVGSVFGPLGARVGFTLGSMLGGSLFAPDQVVEGPRLTDLSVQQAAEGSALPRLWGTERVTGTLIWSDDIVETRHEEEVGGKGGPSATQISYTYSCSFAVALCDNEIDGVRRIWADKKLIYDVTAGASVETSLASTERGDIRVYLGTETQTADATIEADVGAANCPAYRGTAYLVFDTLQLADFGNHIPQIEAEVVTSATQSGVSRVTLNTATGINATEGLFGGAYDNGVARFHLAGSDYILSPSAELVGIETPSYLTEMSSSSGHPAAKYPIGYFGDYVITVYHTGSFLFEFHAVSRGVVGSTGRGTLLATTTNTLGTGTTAGEPVAICIAHSRLWIWVRYSPSTEKIREYDTDLTLLREVETNWCPDYGWNGYVNPIVVEPTENYIWHYNHFGTLDMEVYSFDPDTLQFTQVAIGVDGPSFGGNESSLAAADGICWLVGRDIAAIYRRSPLLTAATVELSDIVTGLCAEAGIAAADIDVTDLTDNVTGYARPRPMSARAALEPLMLAYHFDAVETGGKLVFVKRGAAAAATLADDDIVMRRDRAIEATRRQEAELPQELTYLFQDASQDQQPGLARARRLVTHSQASIRVEAPIVLTSAEGAQIADIALRTAWRERDTYSLAVGPEFTYLDPADVVNLTVAGESVSARITRVAHDPIAGILIEAVREDATGYTSSASATDATLYGTASVGFTGPSAGVVLDLPALRDPDADAGVYVAAHGYLSGWRGAIAMRSVDGGASWSQAATLLSAAAIGRSTATLATGRIDQFDEANKLTVRLNTPNGALASATEAQVLNGANGAALGAHGRWEVLQWRTATDNGDGTYTLSGLLRGRRGTDWAVGTHQSTDTFVALTESALRRVVLGSAEINATGRSWKFVGFGQSLDRALSQSVTATGMALECYPPCLVRDSRASDGTITITWVRRDRVNGEWRDYADVANSESSESYDIAIYDESFATLKRSSTALASASYTYSLANQQTDFGNNGSAYGIRVYQNSAVTGNGMPASRVGEEYAGVDAFYGFTLDAVSDRASTITSSTSTLVLAPSSSASGFHGTNIRSAPVKFIPAAGLEISFKRTQSGSWYDDDLSDAQLIVYVLYDLVGTITFSPTEFAYRMLDPASYSSDRYLRFMLRRTNAQLPAMYVNNATGTEVTAALTEHVGLTTGAFDGSNTLKIRLIQRPGNLLRFELWEGTTLAYSHNASAMPMPTSSARVVFHHHNYSTVSSETLAPVIIAGM